VEPRVVPAPDQADATALLTLLWAATLVSFAGAAVAAGPRPPARLSPALSALGGALATSLGVVLLAGGDGFSASAGDVLGFSPLATQHDGLSAVFLVAFGLSSAAASVSIIGTPPRSRLEGVAYPLFLATIVLVVGASNAFAFLLAWELMALLSTVLVVGLRPTRAVLSAGYLYLAMTHVATAAILVAFAILAANSGGRIDFAAWRSSAPVLADGARDAVFLLVLAGFATKAGAIPLHAWLPRAHPVAPSHVSAVMSGVMIKTGIYGLVRLVVDVLGGGPDWWGVVLVGIGALSAVLGVLYALMQHDLKRLLAFHSVENIGIILIGLGSALVLEAHGAPALAGLALGAALFHSVNHAVFKTLLFLGAGAVLRATGLRDLNRLGGLARAMPVSALAFGIGAAAISGLPPLNGFASEWLVFQGLIGTAGSEAIPEVARLTAAATIGALALTTALAVACFVKATGVTFLGLPRSAAASAARETTRPARAALVVLAAACLGLGLAAGPVAASLGSVAAALVGDDGARPDAIAALTSVPRAADPATFAALAVGLLLIAVVASLALVARRATIPARRVDTWTCGIAPDPAFQYTATSFAKPIRLFFHRVLLPEREVEVEYHPGTAFPVSIRYRSEITLILEERVFRPLHELSLRASHLARRLQGGAIQLYLAYTVVAVLALLLWAR
jgi:hydrogenase-4 component B